MNKWLALAVALFFAGEALAVQEPAGAAELKACQEAATKNDWDSVVRSCEATIAANPDLFLSHYILGWAYLQKKDWAKCASNYDKFLERLGDQKADLPAIGRRIGCKRHASPSATPTRQRSRRPPRVTSRCRPCCRPGRRPCATVRAA